MVNRIIDDFNRPVEREGAKVSPDSNARYRSGNEYYDLDNTRTLWYSLRTGLLYAAALGTYIYCTRNGMRAQRLFSTATLFAIPGMMLASRKGEDNPVGHPRQLTLAERLEFYPITRRALIRAIQARDEVDSSLE